MLSDAICEMRRRVRAGGLPPDTAGWLLELQAFELEARNMEERIALLSGHPHTALDGKLVSSSPIIEVTGRHHVSR